MPHDVIATCPVCSGELAVTRLRCGDCGTVIEGEFGVGRFARLTREQTLVLESFLRSRGNLRDMERELGISYPDGPGPRRGAHPRARVRPARRGGWGGRRGRGRTRRRGCRADRRRRGRHRRGRRHPGRPTRDPRTTVPPHADRRGGRRGHPRTGEDPMTETDVPVPDDPRGPARRRRRGRDPGHRDERAPARRRRRHRGRQYPRRRAGRRRGRDRGHAGQGPDPRRRERPAHRSPADRLARRRRPRHRRPAGRAPHACAP